MDSPEARAPSNPPWLFGRQGLAVLALVAALAATFLVVDLAFLAGCLLLVGLLGKGWSAVSLVRVQFARRPLAERAFCGDDIEIEATLANPRPLPLPWLEVWERLPAALDPEGTVERSFAQPNAVWVQRGLSLWPYQRLRWRRQLHCRQRGVYRLGQVRLRTGDPLGFFERERTVDPQSETTQILVYPRVVPVRRLALPFHHPSLDVTSPRSLVTDPTRTATVRDYRPDDPLRLIHWPTTARRGEVQVRVLEPATSLHVSLVMDVRGFTFGIYRGELLELALSALASIAVYLQDNGFPVAWFANGNPPVAIAPGASVAHLQHVLESMARLEPVAGPPLMPWALAELPRGSTLVLAASEMSSDLARAQSQLEAAGLSTLLLLAVSRSPSRSKMHRDALYLSPGADVAATLEGRA
ncbi:MAG TPA: DUF58 domain-containing protein [Chloroflexota bacterium]|jgi:uncharacterized protein (DUF58 family)